ncbi:MAG: hypothetical protein HOO93_01265 [Methyloglobulus sp.]|nr:hypothetical protein [Methyloglobulus sp.]
MNAIHPAWKWYFWASIIMTIFLLGYDVSEGFAGQGFGDIIYMAAGYLVDALSLVCLYGFAWQIRIGKCQYWGLFLYINAAYFVFSMGYTALSLEPNSIEEVSIIFVTLLIVGFALTLPMLFANFQYAFRNNQLWSTNP